MSHSVQVGLAANWTPSFQKSPKDLRAESLALKEVVADLILENRVLKKNTSGAGGEHA